MIIAAVVSLRRRKLLAFSIAMEAYMPGECMSFRPSRLKRARGSPRPCGVAVVIQYGMFEDELEGLDKRSLLREIKDRATPQGREIEAGGRRLLNFASNDYLGLAGHPALKEAAREALGQYGAGAGASRLLSGGCALHAELEEKTAALKGAEAALVFGSGYAANAGAIPALAGRGDAVFSDELNHASIIDGCRLSRAETFIYRHRDAAHLGELLRSSGAGRKLVVTDTVFSMDGDLAPLPEIHWLAKESGALLYLDDAHGTGVLGGGKGALSHFAITPEPWIIQMGTFSKALGSHGAFVAGDAGTIRWLTNSARSFIFSTALPPPVAAASLAALGLLEKADAPLKRLRANSEKLLDGLRSLGFDAGGPDTPIFAVFAGGVEDVLSLSANLLRTGIYAPAIRPPSAKAPRLRLTVTAAHTDGDIERLLKALKTVRKS